MLGMIAREVEADINVIALVGERGREVLEFIERDLGEKGMARSVLVVAFSRNGVAFSCLYGSPPVYGLTDSIYDPAHKRVSHAHLATAIAEYFKDQGKNVLLMMDSLTRYAMAQREIGLAPRKYPFSDLCRL